MDTISRGTFMKKVVLSVPLAGLTASKAFAGSDYAICAHPSHGSVGWTGPVRTGPKSNDQAWADARAHNKANAGHDASV
jgi:hypothetical protein